MLKNRQSPSLVEQRMQLSITISSIVTTAVSDAWY